MVHIAQFMQKPRKHIYTNEGDTTTCPIETDVLLTVNPSSGVAAQ